MTSPIISFTEEQKHFFKKLSTHLSPLQSTMLKTELEYLVSYQLMENGQANFANFSFFKNKDDALRKFEPLFLRLHFTNYPLLVKSMQDYTTHEVHPDVQPQDIFLLVPDIATKIQNSQGHIKVHFGGKYNEPAVYIDKQHNTIYQQKNSLHEFFFSAGLLSRYPHYQANIPAHDKKFHIEDCKISTRKKYFSRILLGRKPSVGLDFLTEQGILELFLPEVTAGKGLEQNQFHSHDIYHHLLYSCDGMQSADLVLRLSALLHDAGKVPTRKEKESGEATFYNHEMVSARMVPTIMKRLGIDKNLGLEVRFLVRNHMFHYTDEWTDKAIRRFIKKVPPEHLSRLIELRIADRKGSGKRNYFPPALTRLLEHIHAVSEKEQAFKITDLAIGGRDLIELGLPAGPLFGKIFKELLDLVTKDKLPNNREALIEKVKEIVKRDGLSNVVHEAPQ